MKNILNIKQEIMQIKNYSENIRMVVEDLLDSCEITDDIDIDKYCNALEGIAALIDMRSNKILYTMGQCFKLDTYRESVLRDKI